MPAVLAVAVELLGVDGGALDHPVFVVLDGRGRGRGAEALAGQRFSAHDASEPVSLVELHRFSQQPTYDLPGAYSHEYFPKISNDGRWLVWGAAAEGHEHDRADYEIFVWEIGTPWERAVRLTHYPGNDQWPDLWVRPHR